MPICSTPPHRLYACKCLLADQSGVSIRLIKFVASHFFYSVLSCAYSEWDSNIQSHANNYLIIVLFIAWSIEMLINSSPLFQHPELQRGLEFPYGLSLEYLCTPSMDGHTAH